MKFNSNKITSYLWLRGRKWLNLVKISNKIFDKFILAAYFWSHSPTPLSLPASSTPAPFSPQFCKQFIPPFYQSLAWEPSVAQVTHSHSCRLPAFGRFYLETKFSNSILNLKTELWTFCGSPELPNQNLRQIGPGVPELWSDKQTEITTLYI